MDKELFDYIAERCTILTQAGSSKQETKDAAQAWLDATADADDAAIEAATATLLDYLDGRPNTIDGVIAFAEGPAVDMMGAEAAAGMLAAAKAAKEQGVPHCICEACTAAWEILEKNGRIA